MRPYTLAAAAACAALGLAVASPLTGQKPGLRVSVSTATPSIATAAIELFGHSTALPELKRGQNWNITLDAANDIEVVVARDLVGTAQIEVRPALLPPELSARLADTSRTVGETLGSALERSGIAPADSSAIAASVLGLGDQIRSLLIRINGNPDVLDENLEIDFWVAPKPGTWLAHFTRVFISSYVPVPFLADDDTLLSIRAAFLLEKKPELALQPLAAMLTRMGARGNPYGGRDPVELLELMFRSIRGDFSLRWKASGETVCVIGLDERSPTPALFEGDWFIEWLRTAQKPHPDVHTEVKPNAFTYNGVSLHRTETTLGDGIEAGPPYVDGKLVSHLGLADNFLVGAVGIEPDGLTKVIDSIQSRQLADQKLGQTALALITVRLRDYVAAMTQGAAATEDLPERVRFTIGNGGDRLFLKVRVR